MKKSFIQLIQYMSPEILINTLPFITLPITTRYLTLTDFGLLAIFTLATVPFTVFCEFGASFVLSSDWFKLGSKQKPSLLSSLLCLSFAIRILTCIIVSFLSALIFPFLFGDSSAFIFSIFYLLILNIIFQGLDQVFTQWLILTKQAFLFTKIKLFNIFLSTSNTLILAIYTKDVTLILTGQTIILFVLFLIKGTLILPSLGNPNFNLCKHSLNIGYPFFFRSIFNQTRKQIDKFFINSLGSLDSFAIYNWALRFHSLYGVIENHFSKVYSPIMLEDFAQNKIKSYQKIFLPWFFLVLFLSSIFFFIGKPLITAISNGLYTDAYPLILIICCLCLFKAAFQGIMTPLIHYKKSFSIFIITIFSAIANMLCCYLFIPKFGVIGGILGLFLGMLTMEICYSILKQKLTSMFYIELEGIPFALLYSSLISYNLITGNEIGVYIIILNIAFLIKNFNLFTTFLSQTK